MKLNTATVLIGFGVLAGAFVWVQRKRSPQALPVAQESTLSKLLNADAFGGGNVGSVPSNIINQPVDSPVYAGAIDHTPASTPARTNPSSTQIPALE